MGRTLAKIQTFKQVLECHCPALESHNFGENMTPTKTEAIAAFLKSMTHPELSALYNHDMEVQVNVARENGEKIKGGEFKGREWNAFTDGTMVWKPIRIPYKAKSTPEFTDTQINFPLGVYAEGIGMTGWDWKNRLSRWVAFDFDAIMGHADKHARKLDDRQLHEVQENLKRVPFVTLRRSTSGKGLHLYVFLEPVETQNHNEHAALARAILSMLSGLTSFDFTNKVDVCGGNMWIWHRKMYSDWANKIKNDGLKLIQSGCKLTSIPANWRDHIKVTNRNSPKSLPNFVYDLPVNDPDRLFGELTGQRAKISLDPEHRALIDWLSTNNCCWWWDQDSWMLVSHTSDLKDAHAALRMRGQFDTVASGSDRGFDHNCFSFPLRCGAWAVRRYSPGTQEKPTWDQDGHGWTRCFLNKEYDLPTLARLNEGVEHEKGGYVFRNASSIANVLTSLGINVKIPTFLSARRGVVRYSAKDSKLIVHIASESTDDGGLMKDWIHEKNLWKKTFKTTLQTSEPESNDDYDDLIRHITSGGQDAGWVLKRDTSWSEEPLVHIRAALGSMGHDTKEASQIIGSSVIKAWDLVNLPFQPEYPGGRQWNRNSAQLAVVPSLDLENLKYPTWQRILDHCGEGLNEAVLVNEWCKYVGIGTGAEYLMLWISSLFKRPMQPMTYLAFYGPQDSGKSIFHEMISEILITSGCVRADNALQSDQNFNGELANAILGTIEETDMSKDRRAYNRIKDLVTSPQIAIRPLYCQSYMIPNTLHFIQCSNEIESCPIFEGDTRITLIHVASIPKADLIPKFELMARLRKEAPDFLAAVLAMELPESNSRLSVPTLETAAKQRAAEKNMSMLEQFIKDKCFEIAGTCISSDDFYNAMQLHLEDTTDKKHWTKNRIGRDLPDRFPRGRLGGSNDQQRYYGNITLDKDAPTTAPYVEAGAYLKKLIPVVETK